MAVQSVVWRVLRYLVMHGRSVWRLVPEHLKAWHAGKGRLPWETCEPYDFNHRSIGIEVVNPGDGVTPFTRGSVPRAGGTAAECHSVSGVDVRVLLRRLGCPRGRQDGARAISAWRLSSGYASATAT